MSTLDELKEKARLAVKEYLDAYEAAQPPCPHSTTTTHSEMKFSNNKPPVYNKVTSCCRCGEVIESKNYFTPIGKQSQEIE